MASSAAAAKAGRPGTTSAATPAFPATNASTRSRTAWPAACQSSSTKDRSIGYPLPIFDLPDDTSPPARRSSSGARPQKTAAHSYLSLVDGTAMRHSTWADCERRVKGRSGARFKKAVSADDERAILRGWHVDPDSV